MSTATELQQKIIEELKVELCSEPTFKEEILEVKVSDSYRKIRAIKGYDKIGMSDEDIDDDLNKNHYQDIKDLAKYRYALLGADFQTNHTENGVSRTWRNESNILSGIIPYAHIVN